MFVDILVEEILRLTPAIRPRAPDRRGFPDPMNCLVEGRRVSRTLLRLLVIFLMGSASADRAFPQDTRDLSLDSLLVMQISTASKHWETAGEAPASVTVITSEMIQKFGFRTLAEALASVRSFYVSYDRNYTYLGIRGFSRPTDYNDRILLLLNGHTINEGFSGTSPFGTDFALDLNSVDRIEVVRGPGSALYGSGAIFAVVNVITRSVRSFDQTQLGVQAGNAQAGLANQTQPQGLAAVNVGRAFQPDMPAPSHGGQAYCGYFGLQRYAEP